MICTAVIPRKKRLPSSPEMTLQDHVHKRGAQLVTFMLVDLRRWVRKADTSANGALIETLFSHSNSAHICRNLSSVHVAGAM